MKLVRKKNYGHAVPHFNSSGGCKCHCPKCLKDITVRQLHSSGAWVAARNCSCPNCSQECTSFNGRLALEVETVDEHTLIIKPTVI